MADIALNERITNLEHRLSAAEQQGTAVVDSEALLAYQTQMLQKLQEIRKLFLAEQGSKSASSNSAVDSEGQAQLIAKLKADNAKLEYRVQHLVKALNREEAKHA